MKNDQKSLSSPHTTIPSKRHAQFCRRILPALVASCFACGSVWANPSGGVANVVGGMPTATFSQPPSSPVLTITNQPNAIINWSSFSILANETTIFNQVDSASRVLNRVTTPGSMSEIFGNLQSNGKVYLINPNGIVFGNGSQVNVAGLVASSLAMSDTDFLAGNNKFGSVAGTGTIAGITNTITVEKGASITTPTGGQIYLIAPNVTNSGILTSPQGDIVLAAGHQVTMIDSSDPDMRVVVSAPNEEAMNLGGLVALGGKIGIYGALIQLTGGSINADSAATGSNGGVVFLKSSSNQGLNIDAPISASNGTVVINSQNGNVTQTTAGNITANAVSVSAANGSIDLTSSGNNINTIAASSLNTFNFSNSVDTTVGSITGSFGTDAPTNGINAGGIYINSGNALTVNSPISNNNNGDIGLLASSMILNAPVSATGSNNIVALEAMGDITQTAAGPISANNFSAVSKNGSVTLNNQNNNIGTANGIASASGTFSLQASGGYNVGTIPSVGPSYSGSFIPELSLITLSVVGTTVPTSMVYDGTTAITLTGGVIAGAPNGYQTTLTQSGSRDNKNVGQVAVTATNTVAAPSFLFKLVEPTGFIVNVTPAALSVVGQTAGTRTYNGTTNANVTGGTLSGTVFGSDNVILAPATTGTFDTKDVGTNKPVALTTPNTLSGTDALNYTLTQPTVTGDITAQTLPVPNYINGLNDVNNLLKVDSNESGKNEIDNSETNVSCSK